MLVCGMRAPMRVIVKRDLAGDASVRFEHDLNLLQNANV
jgi:hypothetical protein